MEKYFMDLKGMCYHDGKQHSKEWVYKFYKTNMFEKLTDVYDFIDKYVKAFPSTYESILPARVKRFNYFYTYSIYRIYEIDNGIIEIEHNTIVTEVVR